MKPSVVLGAYRRASTHGQRSGWRFRECFDELIQLVLAIGPEYGVMVFDEGARSAASMANRGQIAALLAYLDAGLLQGIVTIDINRLTRDRTLLDGLEIARVLQRRHSILVTPGRIWDLRDSADFRDYRDQLRLAAREVPALRSLFYDGQRKRAQAIVRGDAPPMFKGPPAVGYRSVVCYEPRDASIQWETDPTRGLRPLVHRGLVIRTWTKCRDCGPRVETLREELARHVTLREVAAAMNARGIPSPWRLRDGSRYWTAKLIRQILRQPIYWGHWEWAYTASLDHPDSGERITYQSDFPHLAYWTEQEADHFADTFLSVTSHPGDVRRHEHLANGLIACAVCHCLLRGAGREYSVRQNGRVYSPTRLRCPECGRNSSEDGLLRALDAYFPNALRHIEDLSGQLERYTTSYEFAAEPLIPPILKSQRVRDVAELLAANPIAAYNDMTPPEKATLWRAVLRDANGNASPVEMVRVKKGNSQRSPGQWAVVRSPLDQVN